MNDGPKMKYDKDFPEHLAIRYRDGLTKNLLGRYLDESEKAPVLEMMTLDKNSFLFDAGCGTGRFLANTVSGQQFVGLDLSVEMLKVASGDLNRGHFVVADLAHLPFKDGVFDQVICIRVLQHILNQDEVINELARICKPNGSLIILSYNAWSLLSLYKAIRMGKLRVIFDSVFKRLPIVKGGFRPWSSEYDNYCSIPELKRYLNNAGMDVVKTKGGTVGQPWLFMYFGLANFLERRLPKSLSMYFTSARKIEDSIGGLFPFKYMLEQIAIKGVKRPG